MSCEDGGGWTKARHASRPGPLAGLRVVELGGIGPGPFCGMMLSDLGAEVVRLDRPSRAGMEPLAPVLHRGRRSVAIDLKTPDGVDLALRLVDGGRTRSSRGSDRASQSGSGSGRTRASRATRGSSTAA